MSNYQSKIYNMNSQIQNLQQRNANEAENRARIEQYQNKIALISLEIERVHANFDNKAKQNSKLEH